MQNDEFHIVEFVQSPFSPSLKLSFLNKKGGEMMFIVDLSFYGCFFIIMIIAKPITTMMIASAATAGMKYRSAADGACVGTGVGVAAASSTAKAVTAFEGQ